jgi:hypothetical protein
MRSAWFAPWGWLHYPVSVAGVVVSLATAAYMVQVFVTIDGHSHSATDVLYAVYPHWGVTLLGCDWIARRTTRAPTR